MSTVTRTFPSHLIPTYSEAEIRAGTKRIAEEMTPWVHETLEKTGRQALAVCILRGGVFFFSDVLQQIPVTLEPTFCRCVSYAPNQNGEMASRVEVSFDAHVEISGRHVIVMDDICDSGRTLKAVEAALRERGAVEIKVGVLIHRTRLDSQFHPEHAAFTYDGPEWFAGYGLEDASHYMNYPTVYRIMK